MARRLCCELHDELAQSLTPLKNRLGALTHLGTPQPPSARVSFS